MKDREKELKYLLYLENEIIDNIGNYIEIELQELKGNDKEWTIKNCGN